MLVVLVSFVLVIVAAVTLVIGLLTSGLGLVFASIACSAVAGVVLIVAVLRSRPRPVAATGGPAPLGEAAPWPAREDITEPVGFEAREPVGGFVTDSFPIVDYDDLKVGEIIPLLGDLDVDELEAVREHESGGKARATIITRVDALLDASAVAEPVTAEPWTARQFAVDTGADGFEEFPIADYDDLKVGEITPLLSQLDPDELEIVRTHEVSGKARATILSRIDGLLTGPAPRAPVKRAPAKKPAAKKAAAKAAATTAGKATATKKAPAKKSAAKKATTTRGTRSS